MDPSPLGIGRLILGSLIGVLGLLGVVVSLVGRRRVDPLLASFGCLALLFGVRLFFGTPAVGVFGVDRGTALWIDATITYAINIPGWIFFRQLLGRGWRSILVWWLRLWCAFAVVGILSDLIRLEPGTLTGTPNHLLVIAGTLPLVTTLWHQRERVRRELKTLTAGLLVFGLLAVNDNLVQMGLLPWRWEIESLGFLFLIGCIGFIATRTFFVNEAQLAGIETELKTAREIQMSILPAALPATGELSVAARFRPTSEVAGDLYDFLEVAGEGLGVLVADVSGHGVPAALIASMVKVAVASQRHNAGRPAELLTEVNQTLCGNFQRGFVTATYAWIDQARGEVTVANGGHPSPLLCRAADRAVAEVGGQGAILGRFAGAAFSARTHPLTPGDRLLLYTDGVTEARNPDGEMFGEDRLRSFLGSRRDDRPEAFCDALLLELARWTGGGADPAPGDDVTLVAVDFRPG